MCLVKPNNGILYWIYVMWSFVLCVISWSFGWRKKNLIYDKIFQNGHVHVDILVAKDRSPVPYLTYRPAVVQRNFVLRELCWVCQYTTSVDLYASIGTIAE